MLKNIENLKYVNTISNICNFLITGNPEETLKLRNFINRLVLQKYKITDRAFEGGI